MSSSGSGALVDYFLNVDGIKGTSTDEKHKDAFEIKDFSFGVTNKTTIGSATGGAGAGKIKFNEFTIKKTSDQASPVFFKSCAAGAHYKNVTLTMRKAGRESNDFLKLTLKDVLISSYQQSGIKPPPEPDPGPVDVAALANADTVRLENEVAGSDGPTDSVGFNFANASMMSDPVTIKVSPAATGVFAFDTKTGDWTLTEGGEGGLAVGTEGGVVHRAVQKFDVADLKGLLSLNAGSLNFSINEVRPASEEGEKSSPDPNLHVDVILFRTDDSSLAPVDLKTEGQRIGSLHVDPRGDPASLDIDLTDVALDRVLIGLRVELRGAPLDVDPSDPSGATEVTADQRASGDVVLKGRNILINFTTGLTFDTK